MAVAVGADAGVALAIHHKSEGKGRGFAVKCFAMLGVWLPQKENGIVWDLNAQKRVENYWTPFG